MGYAGRGAGVSEEAPPTGDGATGGDVHNSIAGAHHRNAASRARKGGRRGRAVEGGPGGGEEGPG